MLYKEEFKATCSNYDDQRTMFTASLYDKLNGIHVAFFMVGDPPQRQALLIEIGRSLWSFSQKQSNH